MTSIGPDTLCSAVVVVVMMLVILSVPSILINVRHSAKLLKKYKMLRSIDISKHENVPQQVLNEWNAVNSPMAYTTLITEEIERLNNLKPAIFQCELAVLLMIGLCFVPRTDDMVLWIFIVLIVISVFAVLYGASCTRMYTQEYLGILKEVNENDKNVGGAADGMYG